MVFNFGSINFLNTVIFIVLVFLAKSVIVILHELAHWIVGGFRGKMNLQFFPYPQGNVEYTDTYGDTDPFFKKVYNLLTFEAGPAVNLVFALAVWWFFPSLDFSNWLYLVMFCFGLAGLLSLVMNVLYGKDHTSVFKILGVHNFILRMFLGIIFSAIIIYLFSEYYVENCIKLYTTFILL